MIYAGFWRRLGANLIDSVVLLPFAALPFYSRSLPIAFALIAVVATYASYPVYCIYFVGTTGQTPGKRMVGIRVRMLDGTPATWRSAWLRHAPNVAYGVVHLCFAAVVVLTYSSQDLSAMTFLNFGKAISGVNPYSKWIRLGHGVWDWSEVIVLLTNEKSRALHDFLAGTVVTQEPPNELAFWRRRSASERSERREDRR